MKTLQIFTLAAALLPSGLVMAQQAGSSGQGFYLGANYGGYKARGGDFDDENDLYEIVLGYQITPYISVEGNYSDFGSYGSSLASADVDGTGISLVGQLPVSDSFAIYAKAGQFWWDGDVSAANINRSFDDDSIFYGVGTKFDISHALAITAEYKRYDIEFDHSDFPQPLRDKDTDLDTLTLGVRYSF
ncbi:MAG: porin family protein [Porticoccaceae bacterium]|nr:porin family protein [Porticoccaceae bacterium]